MEGIETIKEYECLGIGDWGLGPIPHPPSPIPNPHPQTPNPPNCPYPLE